MLEGMTTVVGSSPKTGKVQVIPEAWLREGVVPVLGMVPFLFGMAAANHCVLSLGPQHQTHSRYLYHQAGC